MKITLFPITAGARDFYASDEPMNRDLRCVPAGGFAPKRMHFVARVNVNGEVILFDDAQRDNLVNWLMVETLSVKVAQAAEEGRYCHGNGNYFVYVEDGDLVTVSLVDKTIERSPMTSESAQRYLSSNRPYRDLATADSMRAHAASKMIVEV